MHGNLHIAIGIATFRRPEGLARLLKSLDAQRFAGPAPRLTLLIADNDAAVGAAAPPNLASLHPLTYVPVPARGLSEVRNACLDAMPVDADGLVFIDDDEWAEPGWLQALLDMQARTAADIVQGVVRPVYALPAPAWLTFGGYHEVGPFQDGATLDHGASGNVLIMRSALVRSRARFHPLFNRSGGEDVEFFHQMLQSGCRMVAAAGAIAYEETPPDRMTLNWVLRRRWRTGETLGYVARRHGGAGMRALKAVARGGRGIADAAIGAVTSKSRAVRGLTDIAWALGTLNALISRRPFTHRQ
jgi:succinoglycan biosynthesis protein ExoM